ncbi:roquin-2 [Colossoma macropomum]|uniref:roquin-2 n=1 Tax=Colossoma macropomum TaxID=42526 RepID=UPI001865635B|nr:roquin-2 [Colossoma macropomum]XP_036451737.1 roquin-2 [Colossoma macropomum]
MPVQAAQWTEFLSCQICYNEFDASSHKPISLGCSHTVCKTCLHKLHRKACPFDQTSISTDIDLLPVNCALLLLVGAQVPEGQSVCVGSTEDTEHYEVCKTCVEELALYLKPISGGKGVVALSPSTLSRPMQRKLVTLVNCQLVEEEGRMRAVRAARSLGERTVTELILQHQNPQQLSANLWAAVRARGCQFLGPAMQEDALKLVLLALEDGSALSRKVLVLFVVQKLEARFPQASKTSIGHVVQLLYRASCFKVTKRDEDSSLMQLKEEFRTYEALRREHDAQIVHIAMEAGLRISPEQWSSLLYGDLVHKSHMQSIIDKLQSPESFAKSVQELTIVLQRTGDPANLNSLRAPLELLAGIDHNPDAAAPSWEELESVMLAVKVVVHGLVEFIQNFSKKSHETFQAQPNSKYKTSMCRDLRQQGSCPRGANCTFAHTQDELEKYRMRNKKVSGGMRPSPLPQTVVPKSGSMKSPLHTVDAVLGGPQNREQEGLGSEDSSPTRLVPRGGEHEQEEGLLALPNGASGLPTPSQDQKAASPPKTPASPCQTAAVLGPHPTAAPAESGATLPKRSTFPPRGHTEVSYFTEQHSPYELSPCSPSGNYYPSLVNPHKPSMTRFSRSSPAFDSSAPPPLAPPYQEPPPSLPSRDRLGPAHFPPPAYTPIHHTHPHGHGVYAPVYDSRRVWRPQLYHRQDGRSNSLPLEVLHASIYQPPLRERFNSLDSPYCSAADRRAALHRDSYGRAPPGCEDLYRLKQEQWPHQHNNHTRAQSSPVFAVDHCSEHVDSGVCVSCKCGGGEVARYSPWSCGTVSPFDLEPLGSTHSCSQHADVEGAGKHWLHILDPYRRVKDEDPIIPFGEGPIISKWGAISRASRTDYHTTEPVQATAAQGRTSTTPINFRDYSCHTERGDCRWGPCGFDSSRSSFLESDRRRSSFSTGGKQGIDLLVRDGTESEPDRDIELELSALDMEESQPQEHQSEVSLESRTGNHLSSVFSDPAASSQIDQHLPDHMMDAHLLKKMAFRKSLSPGGLSSGGLGVGGLAMKSSSARPVDLAGPGLGKEMLLNGS